MGNNGKIKGEVLWFEKKRGFGFIKPEDGSKDIFVHFSGIVSEQSFKELEKGQKVEFEVSNTAKE
jgi:CspA family cold shock protein